MDLAPSRRDTPGKIIVFGLLAFAILAIRFSPNWAAFCYELRDAKANVTSPAQSAAIDEAILSGYSARGLYVIRQAHDLNTEIDIPGHKIVRWRLLVPALGYFLNLPGWLILSLPQVGCIALIVVLAGLGSRQTNAAGRSPYEAICLGVIAGASAPFFTSMGLLGNYDSWLALALIGVAFVGSRSVVVLTCLLAPWIDERFVIGLPLALCVRRILSDGAGGSRWRWFKQQALLPLILAAGYSMIRLELSGSGGSQTAGQYLNQFVLFAKLSTAQRLYGAWEGLRFGWVLVFAAVLGSWRFYTDGLRLEVLLLSCGVAFTGIVGLYIAQDIGRSMVLLISVVPLGWIFLARTVWWNKLHVAVWLAAAAVLLPASHVLGNFILPVDNLWTPSLALMTARNNLGMIYAGGNGVPKDSREALNWFRKAADQGSAQAQSNLGVMYAAGIGVPKDSGEAVKWLRKAVEQGFAQAQSNLGKMYEDGEGVPKDIGEALNWYRKAAEQGDAQGQCNLGVMYANGYGVPKDSGEAVNWYRRAAEQGHVRAQCDLGAMYASGDGVPKNSGEAVNWYRKAAEQGNAEGQENLGLMYAKGEGVAQDMVKAHLYFSIAGADGRANAKANLTIIEKQMTPEQIAEATRLAGILRRR